MSENPLLIFPRKIFDCYRWVADGQANKTVADVFFKVTKKDRRGMKTRMT